MSVNPGAEEAIRRGSRSFAAAARLFEPAMREGAILLYAWCRHCDDAIDGQLLGRPSPQESGFTLSERLNEVERQTRAALGGRPQPDPAFAGLQEVVRRHRIPHGYVLAHLDGYRMDAGSRRYDTLADTLDYAFHVAGVVGVMMAYVMGATGPSTLDRASDLGIAFQLTNIARDIVEDARAGRLYLPAEWLREAGIPPDEVAAPAHRERLARVAWRLLDAAEPYYASAAIGIGDLPFRAAWAIAAARGIYRQIGQEVRALGAGAWDRRIATSAFRKAGHVLSGAALALASRRSAAPEGARHGLYSRPV